MKFSKMVLLKINLKIKRTEFLGLEARFGLMQKSEGKTVLC